MPLTPSPQGASHLVKLSLPDFFFFFLSKTNNFAHFFCLWRDCYLNSIQELATLLTTCCKISLSPFLLTEERTKIQLWFSMTGNLIYSSLYALARGNNFSKIIRCEHQEHMPSIQVFRPQPYSGSIVLKVYLHVFDSNLGFKYEFGRMNFLVVKIYHFCTELFKSGQRKI